MAFRQVWNEIKCLKVKELPQYLKPRLTIEKMNKAVERGMDNYHAKYIATDSAEPIYHVCFGGMAIWYFVNLPEERRHLEHQKHAKEHGGH